MAKEIYKKDLYAILGVSEEAPEKEIVKGYRKKALKCHPDKNPDNPKAAELFHELSKALEILTDAAARAAYDQSRKAKKAAEARNKVLDSKRKKFKEDLEARERAVFEQNEKAATAAAERKLQAEIERLRKEGSRLLEQEQERLREELRQSKVNVDDDEDDDNTDQPRIKLKWKALKGDPSNGGYNSDNLNNILSCYGKISTLIVSGKRNGSAIVEFENSGVSSDILEEKGLKDNPFSIVWLSGKPRDDSHLSNDGIGSVASNIFNINGGAGFSSSAGVSFEPLGSSKVSMSGGSSTFAANSGGEERNFENLVLMRMRQAEERKRLIEQMQKEDENDG